VEARAPQPGGGGALWAHLTALVLIPMLGVGALSAAAIHSRAQEFTSATQAERAVRAVGQLDAARSATEREVLPSMSLAMVRDDPLATAVRLAPSLRDAIRRSALLDLRTARRATDRALETVSASSPDAGVAARVRKELGSLRSSVDEDSVPVQVIQRRYQVLADDLARAQQAAAAEATSRALTPQTARATRDVQQLARGAQVASRQLPLLLRVQALPAGQERSSSREWSTSWSTYTVLAAQMQDLSSSDLRRRWTALRSEPAIEELDQDLQVHAEDPDGTRLTMQQLNALVNRSAQREQALNDVLERAVGHAVTAAAADRAEATSRMRHTLALGVAVLVASAGAVLLSARSLSRSLRRLAGQAREISRGHLVDVDASGPREVRTVAQALAAAVASLRRVQGQAQAVANGQLSDDVLSQPLPGPLGEVVHASVLEIVSGVRQREQLQADLAHQAAHDPLTGLPNRAQALRLVESALHRARRSGAMTGLLFIDLDHFKSVNDSFGHACGDEVLRVVAARLGGSVRTGDVVCRLGGDEFVALLEPVDDEQGLVELADRLIAAVCAPITVGNRAVSVGASVGIAVSRDAGVEAGAFLAEADAAAYRAKSSGRGRAELFDDALRIELSHRAHLEAALAAALEDGELELHYQPVVDVASGALTGYEALARWNRPGHGVVAPGDFIPVAEHSGLICDVGRWALHEATRQLAAWRAETPAGEGEDGSGRPEPTVAVNISGRHLASPQVLDDVTDALAASGLPARLLVVEITETVLVDDPAAAHHLTRLRALGVSIAIDDFGTGYTSIGQLPRLPVDVLKIDRSFVASSEPGHRQLVSLIISAAHTFGLSVVAEGVEDAQQLLQLRDDACDAAQGFLFSRPVPPEQASPRLLALHTRS
jgi:diguanylate cyclase (GGDEF)-like protein